MREKGNYRVSSNLDGYFCTGPACVAASCSICGAEVPSYVLGWGLEGACPPVGGSLCSKYSHRRALGSVLSGVTLPVEVEPAEPGPPGGHVCPSPPWGQNLTPLQLDYFTYRSVACGVQAWVSFENSN